jgi:hypothetical protein
MKGVEMKRYRQLALYLALGILLLVSTNCVWALTERVYFAIEVNETVCGYAETEVSPMVEQGKEMILLKQTSLTTVRALGAKVESDVNLIYHIDPQTGQFIYHQSDVKQGSMELWSKVYIEGGKARVQSSLTGDKTVDLPPDIVLENPFIYGHLIDDLVDGGLYEETYEVFDVRDAEVQTTTYAKVDIENMTLAGERYRALVADVVRPATGLKYRIWVDTGTGRILQTELPNGRRIYRSGESVKKRTEMASIDDVILAEAGVLIADFQAISYMRVKAKVEPSGLRVTPDGLNVPGQRFTGTVDANLIDGVFEIEHKRYDGSGAPVFPPDFSQAEDLAEYLEPAEFMESDDPVLVTKARELTEGSKDSWEAAVRLSQWVAENIGYAIPGGGTARKTYDIRAGECGGHSFLVAAFCRAVGIPARVVWGCMYVTNRGGSFGQHAWNEIYMGDAGWIPIDATVMETDYLDSGHIRFGLYQSLSTSFNPHRMKVLDYRLGPEGISVDDEAVEDKYEAYLGDYKGPEGLEAKVFIQNGSLTVDIPGRIALAFDEPDAEGKWQCKVTDRLYIIFEKDDSDEINVLNMHQLVPLQRQSDLEDVDEDVPDELKPYLGIYSLVQLQAEFKVFHRGAGLAVYDPTAKQTIGLQPPDERGRWVDEFDKNSMMFDTDDAGNVTAMIIDSSTKFRR